MGKTRPHLRSKMIGALALFLAAIFIGVFAFAYPRDFSRRSLINEGLIIDDADLDFGDRWESEKAELRLAIHNPTSRAVRITGFLFSCECLGLEPEQLTIRAGETTVVTGRIDLSAATCREKADEVQEPKITIHPMFAGASPRQRGWTVHGRVRPAIVAEPSHVDFGDENIRGKTAVEKQVILIPKTGLKQLAVTCAHPLIEASLVKPASQDGYMLRASIKKDAPYGRIETELVITAQTDERNKRITKLIPVRGDVAGEVRAVPAKLFLGSRPVGDKITGSITVHSFLGSEFDIIGFQPVTDGLQVDSIQKLTADTKVVHVTRKVLREGSNEIGLTILVKTSDGSEEALTVPIASYGASRLNAPQDDP